MLSILPSYYLVFLGLGLAAVVVVFLAAVAVFFAAAVAVFFAAVVVVFLAAVAVLLTDFSESAFDLAVSFRGAVFLVVFAFVGDGPGLVLA